MKKVYLLVLPLCCFLFSDAQQNQWNFYYTEEFYFVKEVPVLGYRGKNFRFEIAVKANPSDTNSKVHIHGAAIGKIKDDILDSDYKIETRREQDWTIYTVVGKVDKDAWKLWIYAAVNGNGHFFFDDLNCYIEESAGKWKQLRLFNGSFEEKSPNIFTGYLVSGKYSEKVRTAISFNVYKTGKRSLHVQTKGQKPVIETDYVKKAISSQLSAVDN